MDWDDLDLGDFREFVKFDSVPPMSLLASLYEEKVEVLYCKVDWNTLEKFKNEWDKTQYRVDIEKYLDYRDGLSLDNIDYYLPMGKRLLKAMTKFHQESPKQKNVKILRVGEGFHTHYFVEAFNPKNKKTLFEYEEEK